MDILLFDQNTGGHHGEYAGRLVNALSDHGLNVGVLVSKESKVSEFTSECEIHFLTGDTKQNLRQLFDIALESGYDAIHILHFDDLVGAIDSAEIENFDAIPVVATINGSFFNHFLINEMNAVMLKHIPSLTSFIPREMGFNTLLKEYYINRITNENKIDKILTHSEEAKSYIDNITNCGSTSVIPDPVKIPDHNVDKNKARDVIGVNKNGIQLLYFGELRENKGITFLLKSLKAYDGPEFRLVIAGKPSDVGHSEIETLIDSLHLPVVKRLEYIEESQLPYYFWASDGVLIPYKRRFGSRRTSGVFQKACAHYRPVITSDFGVIGRQTKQYDIGTTFKPESTAHLNKTIVNFVESESQIYSSHGLEQFSREHSFDQLARNLVTIYQTVC